jgi:Flp pilus assembly secretin CpaC
MTLNTCSLTAAVIASITFSAVANRSSAAERVEVRDVVDRCLDKPCPLDSNDLSSRGFGTSTIVSDFDHADFRSLAVDESIALDLPRDVSDVLIGNPKTANAVLRSKRRAYIIGIQEGQTNIFFYDDKGHQIDGFNINVTAHGNPQRIPAKEISVTNGLVSKELYVCAPMCALYKDPASKAADPVSRLAGAVGDLTKAVNSIPSRTP